MEVTVRNRGFADEHLAGDLPEFSANESTLRIRFSQSHTVSELCVYAVLGLVLFLVMGFTMSAGLAVLGGVVAGVWWLVVLSRTRARQRAGGEVYRRDDRVVFTDCSFFELGAYDLSADSLVLVEPFTFTVRRSDEDIEKDAFRVSFARLENFPDGGKGLEAAWLDFWRVVSGENPHIETMDGPERVGSRRIQCFTSFEWAMRTAKVLSKWLDIPVLDATRHPKGLMDQVQPRAYLPDAVGSVALAAEHEAGSVSLAADNAAGSVAQARARVNRSTALGSAASGALDRLAPSELPRGTNTHSIPTTAAIEPSRRAPDASDEPMPRFVRAQKTPDGARYILPRYRWSLLLLALLGLVANVVLWTQVGPQPSNGESTVPHWFGYSTLGLFLSFVYVAVRGVSISMDVYGLTLPNESKILWEDIVELRSVGYQRLEIATRLNRFTLSVPRSTHAWLEAESARWCGRALWHQNQSGG